LLCRRITQELGLHNIECTMPPKRDSTFTGVTEARLVEILDNLKKSIVDELRREIEKLKSRNNELSDLVIGQQLEIDNLQSQNLACNLILAGVEDKADDKQADLLQVQIQAICKATSKNFANADIVDHYRLGKAQNNKVRPIKIFFSTQERRNNVLFNSKNLQSIGQFQGVYINKDETKLARAENQRLRSKMRDLRKLHPNGTVVIRKGKLLHDDVEVDHLDLKNQLQQSIQ
jgi:hypothetical protein